MITLRIATMSNPFEFQLGTNNKIDAKHVLDDAQHLAGETWGMMQSHGPILAKEVAKNPLAVAEVGVATGLTIAAVVVESPILTGLFITGAVGAGCAAVYQGAKPYIEEAGKAVLQFPKLQY